MNEQLSYDAPQRVSPRELMNTKRRPLSRPAGYGPGTPSSVEAGGNPDVSDTTTLCAGIVIVNADDWGRDRDVTDRALDCVLRRTVSSVSAMVFMEDSERAAEIALEHGIDAGLHLNFTTPFSAPRVNARLLGHQQRLSQYLRRSRFSQVVFHPGLAASFEYVVAAQRDEFIRLFGREPDRLDGHHHMHLCANVLLGGLLPPGTVVRRNFSFQPGEKSAGNRFYRRAVDSVLARQHRLTDYFFSLPPLEPSGRLDRIFCLARRFVVEIETHPLNSPEYTFLTEGGISRLAVNCPIASRFAICPNEASSIAPRSL